MGEESIERLFLSSADPNRVDYHGQVLVRVDRFTVRDREKVKLVVESIGSRWRQAIRLQSDLPLEVNGVQSKSLVLWSDTMPLEVVCTCRTKTGELVVYNAWDDGSGTVGAWTGNAAMVVEELPNGRRYRCNDGKLDADFQDIVFRIERVTD